MKLENRKGNQNGIAFIFRNIRKIIKAIDIEFDMIYDQKQVDKSFCFQKCTHIQYA